MYFSLSYEYIAFVRDVSSSSLYVLSRSSYECTLQMNIEIAQKKPALSHLKIESYGRYILPSSTRSFGQTHCARHLNFHYLDNDFPRCSSGHDPAVRLQGILKWPYRVHYRFDLPLKSQFIRYSPMPSLIPHLPSPTSQAVTAHVHLFGRDKACVFD